MIKITDPCPNCSSLGRITNHKVHLEKINSNKGCGCTGCFLGIIVLILAPWWLVLFFGVAAAGAGATLAAALAAIGSDMLHIFKAYLNFVNPIINFADKIHGYFGACLGALLIVCPFSIPYYYITKYWKYFLDKYCICEACGHKFFISK